MQSSPYGDFSVIFFSAWQTEHFEKFYKLGESATVRVQKKRKKKRKKGRKNFVRQFPVLGGGAGWQLVESRQTLSKHFNIGHLVLCHWKKLQLFSSPKWNPCGSQWGLGAELSSYHWLNWGGRCSGMMQSMFVQYLAEKHLIYGKFLLFKLITHYEL